MNQTTKRVRNALLLSPLCIVAAFTAPCTAQGPTTDADRIHHFLRRVSFGPEPLAFSITAALPGTINDKLNGLLDLQGLGPAGMEFPENTILENQLDQTLQPPLFALAASQGDPGTITDLQKSILLRNVTSYQQLRTFMAHFWARHFSNSVDTLKAFTKNHLPEVDAESYAVHFTRTENDWFRDNALGSFRDLLYYSATHVPMLVYLNGNSNTANNVNENYAREMLELHTMGPVSIATGAANYSQQDIQSCAKILTGWRVNFIPPLYYVGPADIFHATFNGPIFPPYVEQGALIQHVFAAASGPLATKADLEALFDHIVSRRATKEFIIRKLIAFFYNDKDALAVPSPKPFGSPGVINPRIAAIIEQAITAWGSDGDIKAVLNVILRSTYFLNGQAEWTRMTSPVESIAKLPRALGALSVGDPGDPSGSMTRAFNAMKSSRERLFQFPSPDGYPLESGEQLGTQAFFQRLAYARNPYQEYTASSAFAENFDFTIPVADLLVAAQFPNTNAASLADKLLFRFVGTTASPSELARVIDLLNTDPSAAPQAVGQSPLSSVSNAADAGRRVLAAIYLIAGFPRASMK